MAVQEVVAQTGRKDLAGCRLKLRILVDMQQILLAMAAVVRRWSRCSGLRKLIRYRWVLLVFRERVSARGMLKAMMKTIREWGGCSQDDGSI
jgi:hypothetical protein